jgi:hypothetical protein
VRVTSPVTARLGSLHQKSAARDVALAALRLELETLKARVTRLEGARDRRDERRAAALLTAIADAVGDHVFTTAELVAHAQTASPPLAAVLARAGLSTPMQIGKRLRRVCGRDVDGLRLERLGVAHGGVQWVVVKVIPTR